MADNKYYIGIRFLDENWDYIINETFINDDDKLWEFDHFFWTDVVEIPDGQQIIGVRYETFYKNYIGYLSFITGPIDTNF